MRERTAKPNVADTRPRGFSGYAARSVTRAWSATLLAWLASACASAPADLVLVDATVYTGVDDQFAQALAVRGGGIVAVGSNDDVLRHVGPDTPVVSLPGAMIVPGFVDAHVHPVTGGVELGQCDLNDARTREALAATIHRCDETQTGAWLRGGGWDLTLFDDAHPRATDLDALVGDRPAYLGAADSHSAWVNTAALRAAGIDATTPDPPGGRIERGPDGAPTGTLREAAMALVERELPATTAAEREVGLRRALAMAHGFGVTALHEANATPEVLAAYVALAQRGELTARVVVALHIDPTRGPEQLAVLRATRDALTADPTWLRASAIKIFADGVIESHTAALLEPYQGGSDVGALALPAARLRAIVIEADRLGFDLHVHAIGDRAIRETLDALAQARASNPARERRDMIAHVQLVDPADLPRFAELGVIANLQPLWAYPDAYITDLTEPVLGPARARWLYPFRSLAEHGARLVAGSDWSVSSMNPLRAMEVAVTRRDPDVHVGAAWIPQETIDVATILRAYTTTGAWALRLDDDSGTIEVGKRADLAVLDRNLLAIPASDIADARVLATLVDGRLVHGAWPASEPRGRRRLGRGERI